MTTSQTSAVSPPASAAVRPVVATARPEDAYDIVELGGEFDYLSVRTDPFQLWFSTREYRSAEDAMRECDAWIEHMKGEFARAGSVTPAHTVGSSQPPADGAPDATIPQALPRFSLSADLARHLPRYSTKKVAKVFDVWGTIDKDVLYANRTLLRLVIEYAEELRNAFVDIVWRANTTYRQVRIEQHRKSTEGEPSFGPAHPEIDPTLEANAEALERAQLTLRLGERQFNFDYPKAGGFAYALQRVGNAVADHIYAYERVKRNSIYALVEK